MSITLLASDMILTVLWLVLVLGLATGRHSDSRCTANSSQCPTCYVPTAGNESSVPCECGIQNQRLVKCDQSNLTAHTLAGVCMTYNETEDSTAVGQCPYGGSSKVEGLHNHLPCNVSELNSFMCDGLNRMGQLCAHCNPGLGPAVLSFPGKCLECLDSRYGWLVFLAIGFLPMTFFCIFVVIFRIHAFSAPMNAFIFVCHYITNAIYLDPYLYTIVTQQGSNVLVPAHMVIAFYGFWNLDFFRYALPQFCLSEKLNSLQAIALEYIAAVYPPVFLILIYICIEWHDRGCTPIAKIWKPFRMCFAKFRRSWEIKGSVINAFATVVLLSFSKLFQISIGLITPLRVYKYYSNRTETVTALNYGENTPYFSSGHIPYFILVISVFFTFNMLPMLFLLLYTVKGFQQCLNRVLGRRVFFLNAFAEVFQGCYKNGIQSKSDCRYFAGMYLLFRVIFLVHYFTPFYYGALLQICISILIAVLFFTINPYSTHFYNLLDGFFFIMVAAAYTYIWLPSLDTLKQDYTEATERRRRRRARKKVNKMSFPTD